MSIWSEYAQFFREFRRDFHHTGAILPSGAFLAAALARPVAAAGDGRALLEVGPGTGSVTRTIARQMRPADRLDAVEINPHFADLLQARVRDEAAFAACRDRVRVVNAPIQDVPGEAVYDVIVCGLPFNNFAPDEIRSIFAAFQRLVRPGGLLSYFEYAFIRQLKTPFVGRAERERLRAVGAVMDGYLRASQVRRDSVLCNVPPAIVRQLCLRPAACDAPAAGVS